MRCVGRKFRIRSEELDEKLIVKTLKALENGAQRIVKIGCGVSCYDLKLDVQL